MAKNPKSAYKPTTGKLPRLETDPKSYHNHYPSWRIKRLEMVDPFGWHDVDKQTVNYIKEKLGNVESMTWAEIFNSRQHHNVSVDKLCPHARERLRELRQDDLEEVLSIRLSGKERVWGILSEGVCSLLWWDPNHDICPSQLGHT